MGFFFGCRVGCAPIQADVEQLGNIPLSKMNLQCQHCAWIDGWMITVHKQLVNNDKTIPSSTLLLLEEASAASRWSAAGEAQTDNRPGQDIRQTNVRAQCVTLSGMKCGDSVEKNESPDNRRGGGLAKPPLI